GTGATSTSSRSSSEASGARRASHPRRSAAETALRGWLTAVRTLEDSRIDDVDGRLPTEDESDVAGCLALEVLNRLLGVEGCVRRQDHIAERSERMLRGRGLRHEDVERSPGDPTLAQRLEQRVLVDERAARGVDEVRRRLHGPQLLPADQ